jgi:deoxyadenosine/deoxycytidine kinase
LISKTANFIVIAGNIGVGKTTLTRQLAQRFDWHVYYEPNATNPYLEDFYKDMRRWAFQSQVFFLTQRFKDHLTIQESKNICIQDRSIYEDAEIFAFNLHQRELMPERDYIAYKDLYDAMKQSLKRPKLTVYLKASAWTLISRIRKRGRSYERDIDREYIAQLNMAYDNWIRRTAEKWDVLVIDTDNYDLEQDQNWQESIIDEIAARIK